MEKKDAKSKKYIERRIKNELETTDDNLLLVLRGHLYIENELQELLKRYIPNPEAFENMRLLFKNKADLTYALNLIEEKYYKSLLIFNSFRNKYAHDIDYTITAEKVDRLKQELAEMNGMEIFGQEEIFIGENTPTTNLKAILIALQTVLAIKVRLIKRAEEPFYDLKKIVN